MTECLVGFGHSMGVFTFAYRTTTTFGRIYALVAQAQDHGLLAAALGSLTQPTHCQGSASYGTDLYGHLIVGTPNTTAFDLDNWFNIINGGVENLEGFLAGCFLDVAQCAINDALGNSFFAREHHNVHKFSDIYTAINWIWQDFSFGYFATARHDKFPCDNSVEPRFTAMITHHE